MQQERPEEECSMWSERFADACRDHPDLAAVFESSSGALALLLRHTLVPLEQEHEMWLVATRGSSRQILRHLRAAGLRGAVRVVQWLPLSEANEIMGTWICRLDRDAARRAQLHEVARRHVQDERFLAACVGRSHASGAVAQLSALEASGDWAPLARWYRSMTDSWRTVEPGQRRLLVLTTHEWVAAHLMRDLRAASIDPRDLEDGGALGRALRGCLPADQLDDWSGWIQLVLGDLRQALRRPVAARNQPWARWLFLIPYSIPAPAGRAGGRDARQAAWGWGRASRDGDVREAGMDWWGRLDGEILDCLELTGTTTPAELSRRLGVSEAATSSLLATLVREGKVRMCLVERADSA
jgi:hypothetical protein